MNCNTKFFGALLINFILFFLIDCSKETKIDDKKVFRYNEHSNISSLDPAFSSTLRNIWPVNQLFNGLVQLDDQLKIVPDLAKNWKISEDGIKYTFKLRSDVFFHESISFGENLTRTVNATDFEYSFNRILDPNLGSPGLWAVKNIKDFEAINDSIFTITLNKPFPAFLGMLSMKYFSVVPKESLIYYGDKFGKNPVGTGPFKFKKWEENIKLVLRKNNQYFEKDSLGKQLPYLEAISITFLPDKKSEFMEFAQKKIDFINSIDASFKDQLISNKGNLKEDLSKSMNLISGPYLNTEYIGFFLGNNKGIVNSKKLRQAINYAIDKKKMMMFLRNNIGYPANNGFIPIGLESNRIKGYEYNFEKAKKLIEEYKKETNNDNIEITLTSDANYLDIIEFIQRELQKIDVNISINIVPASTLRQGKSNGKFEMFRASWIADYPDSENYLNLFYSKNFSPNGPNYTHFKNSQYDNLFESSYLLQNEVLRREYYKKLDSIIIENAVIIPLYYDKVMRFTNKNVQGLNSNPINQLNLKRVYKK